MRTQVLREAIERIDAVLMTHVHADHIFGMDDLRQFNFVNRKRIPVFGTPDVLDHLRVVFSYCFRETQAGGGKPQIDLVEINPYGSLEIAGVSILPLTVLHGVLPITAFRFGERFAYVTDVSAIPDETLPHLQNLDVLILDAVRHEPHPTHFGLGQALDVVAQLRPRQTYLTHLSHHFDYEATMRELPPGVALGYDGLTFHVPLHA
jgi:phosphoribosyl 1,2-cyclic phosphate phosphodiesterase